MRIALISDIHANLPALEAVLADIDSVPDIDVIYHLGDLVGYAPWPNEVVALLRERVIAGVAGNYDSTTATHYKHCGCVPRRAASLRLPKTIEDSDFFSEMNAVTLWEIERRSCSTDNVLSR